VPTDLLRTRYGITAGALTPLTGGEACTVYLVEAPTPVVIRLSPTELSVAELAWAYAAAVELGQDIPEVVRPIAALDGSLVVDAGGSPMSVWPAVGGAHLDREDPAARESAARLLAKLHRAAGRIAVGPRPGPRTAPPPAVDLADVDDPDLADRLRRWRSGNSWPSGVVHGDFFRGNLLWRDGRITGLIDWDEARIDCFAAELAWSVWEFAKGPDGDRLRPDRAAAFLSAYRRAGGPRYPGTLLGALIRQRLRSEIRRSRIAAALGRPHDLAYEAAEVRAFATVEDDLRGLR
jgi:homoserine kinase type II